MKKVTNFHIIFLLLVLCTSFLSAQTTWTGNTSTAWNDPNNWSAGVPDAADDVTIPDVTTNDPIISTAVLAKSVSVLTDASLEVAASGSLTINGFAVHDFGRTAGMYNEGVVTNSGNITLGSTANVGDYGVWNKATFNNIGGELNIDNSVTFGIHNHQGATFTNSADINIGANDPVGSNGIDNSGTFDNLGGEINIDNSRNNGIYNPIGGFNNSAIINIGANASVGRNGISNFSTFNNTNGELNIDQSTSTGIYNGYTGSFTNLADINIGANASVGANGIENYGSFNNTNGELNIDNSTSSGIFNNIGVFNSSIGAFSNAAVITMGANTSVGQYGISNRGAFNNFGCTALLNVVSNSIIENDGGNFVNNSGTIIENASGDSEITSNSGTVQNLNGGTFTTGGSPAVTTPGHIWTGCVSTDWATPGNWHSGTVPTASDDVTIPDVANDPVIDGTTAGLAKSVTVQTDASLTVNAIGSLTINGFAAHGSNTTGLYNEGMVTNNGNITLGSTASVGNYGIWNKATFNNTAGELNIDNSTNMGILNANTFTNSATITIGASNSVGDFGILNQATFTNQAGEIKIDRSESMAIYHPFGVFTNQAIITIGANEYVGSFGITITSSSTFNNQSGEIKIDRSSSSAIFIEEGTFTNSANITIGANASVGSYGILNGATFNNLGGELKIDRFTSSGIYNSGGTLLNGAIVTIGSGNGMGSYGVFNSGSFSNTDGELNIDNTSNTGIVNLAFSTFTNLATIHLGANAPVGSYGINNSSTFDNLGGEINIDDVGATGILNGGNGLFTNQAEINIGANKTIGVHGIYNGANFTNGMSGEINIDDTGDNGTVNENSNAIFTNQGKINIGNNKAIGTNGVNNSDSANFANEADGEINIDDTGGAGISSYASIFTNQGKINIGANKFIGGFGISNASSSNFTNETDGEINIDRSTSGGIFNNIGSFTNEAAITIGAIASVGSNGIENQATFNNQGCTAVINIISDATVTNASGTFSNSGIIIENATGTSNITSNSGIVQNLNGGTFTIGSGNAAVAATGHIWTGCLSSNWATPGNWLAGTVPTTTDDVTIPNVTNDPVIIGSTAAVAKSVTIETGASLDIEVNGSLTIDGAVNNGLDNSGTVSNSGTLNIDQTGLNGILNQGAFNNSGDIKVGLAGPGSITKDGILNMGLFNNLSTGTITARNTDYSGVALSGELGPAILAIFNNYGLIDVAKNRHGVYNWRKGVFNNFATIVIYDVFDKGLFNRADSEFHNEGGDITINRCSYHGILNSGTFINQADISIGGVESVGPNAIQNHGVFNNLGGEINIDRSTSSGIYNSGGTFTNAADITIGANAPVGIYGIYNAAVFDNEACAEIYIFEKVQNFGTMTNAGLFSINTANTSLPGNFTNDGIIEDIQGTFPAPGGGFTNNEIIIASFIGECTEIAPAFMLGNPLSFNIVGVFTDEMATNSAGTFSNNTFTPYISLVEGSAYDYFVKITDPNGQCDKVVSWMVTIDDVTPPTFTCPDNQNINVNPGSCEGTIPDLLTGIMDEYDNCGTATLSQAPSANTLFSGGHLDQVLVTVTANDGNGNQNTTPCVVTLTLNDNEAPTFTCPGNQIISTDPGSCSGPVPNLLTGITDATDNCSTPTLSQSVNANTTFGNADGDQTQVTITADDGNGNQNTTPCVVTLTLNDNQAPTFTCPGNQIISTNNGNCEGTVPDLLTGITDATDNCGTPTLSQSVNANTTFGNADGDQTQVTITADDGNGNQNTTPCVVTLTLNDNEAPTFTCPGNQIISTNNGNCEGTVPDLLTGITDATDNCSTPTLSQSVNANTTFSGPIDVTITADDGNGNQNTTPCIVSLTLNDGEDPVPTCLGPTVGLGANGQYTLLETDVLDAANSTDNCGTVNFVSMSPASVNCNDVWAGPVTVTVTVNDGNGNENTCTSLVTVEDNTLPVPTCKTTTVQLDATGNYALTQNDVYGGGTDNCTTVNFWKMTPAAVDCSQAGTTVPVLVEVFDASGNQASCTANVTVEDAEAPVAICPANIPDVVLDGNGNGSLPANIGDGSSTDNCSATETSPAMAFNCSAGPQMVTLTVTDGFNTVTTNCSFNVVDNQAPVAHCPTNIPAVQLDANGSGSLPANIGDGSSTDNCSATETSPAMNFSCTDVGTQTVVLTASDGTNSSTETCTFNVVDNILPAANCVSQTIQATLDANAQYTVDPNQLNENSTDACGIQSLSASPAVLDCQHEGTNTVTLTVTDSHGNTASCTATIEVAEFLTLDPPTATAESCTGAGDGTVYLTATAGGGQVKYSIDGGATYQASGSFGNLSPGTYTIVVKVFGVPAICEKTATATVAAGGSPTTWFKDMDGDGYTDGTTVTSCAQPTGYINNPLPGTDCNDYDPLAFPGQAWYEDLDGDGYGSGNTQTSCLRPAGCFTASELIAVDTDCNDLEATVNPAATEICDGLDNDCNGETDEGLSGTYVGNVFFTTQAQLDAWLACYDVIQGSVTIQGGNITDLTPLSNIVEITGNLMIMMNAVLTSLDGLENLADVGGALYMYYNFQLSDCCAIDGLLTNNGVAGATIIFFNAAGSHCNSEAAIEAACPINPLVGGSNNGTFANGTAIGMPQAERLTLYPNPVSGTLSVRTRGMEGQPARLTIVNGMGVVVLEMEVDALTKAPLQVGTAQLKDGIYYLTLQAAGAKQVSSRFVKTGSTGVLD